MSTHTYSLSVDFSNNIQIFILQEEIVAESGILSSVDAINIDGDDVDIIFDGVLGGPEITLLDAVVAAHDGASEPPTLEIIQEGTQGTTTTIKSSQTVDRTLIYPDKDGTLAITSERVFETVVDAAGNGDYTSLHDAITASKNNIYIRNGVYTGAQLDVPEALISGLTIVGESKAGVILQFTLRLLYVATTSLAGTLNFTINSTAVTGTATNFDTVITDTGVLVVENSPLDVASVTDATNLVLVNKWLLPTQSIAYAARKTYMFPAAKCSVISNLSAYAIFVQGCYNIDIVDINFIGGSAVSNGLTLNNCISATVNNVYSSGYTASGINENEGFNNSFSRITCADSPRGFITNCQRGIYSDIEVFNTSVIGLEVLGNSFLNTYGNVIVNQAAIGIDDNSNGSTFSNLKISNCSTEGINTLGSTNAVINSLATEANTLDINFGASTTVNNYVDTTFLRHISGAKEVIHKMALNKFWRITGNDDTPYVRVAQGGTMQLADNLELVGSGVDSGYIFLNATSAPTNTSNKLYHAGGQLVFEGNTLSSGANNLSAFSATTSAQLAGVISDETGSGNLVFATSPTLITPVLGTPTSGLLSNCTGLPNASVVGLGDAATRNTGATSGLVNKCGATLAFSVPLLTNVAGNTTTAPPAGTGLKVLRSNVGETAIEWSGRRMYSNSATDPVSPTPADGDKYYNTALREEMNYDAGRSKWLSVASFAFSFGSDTTTAAGVYYKLDGKTMTSIQGTFVRKCTIVYLGFTQLTAIANNLEILENGSVIYDWAMSAVKTNFNSPNVDVGALVLTARNKSTSGTTVDAHITGWFKLRV